jgi:hypothetical protein
MSYPFAFYTSHCQFYIFDKGAPSETDLITMWTKEASDDRLITGKSILVAITECYGPVKGELYLLEHENSGLSLDEYDHIVEAGLEFKSGIIQILACPTNSVHLELSVSPGKYRVRIYSSNLASVIGDDGDDFYRVEIWPDKTTERRVLKRYCRPGQ